MASHDQATWIWCIIRVFFNRLSCLQHVANLFCTNLALEHPLNRMKAISDFFVNHGQAVVKLFMVPSNKSFLVLILRAPRSLRPLSWLAPSCARGSPFVGRAVRARARPGGPACTHGWLQEGGAGSMLPKDADGGMGF